MRFFVSLVVNEIFPENFSEFSRAKQMVAGTFGYAAVNGDCCISCRRDSNSCI